MKTSVLLRLTAAIVLIFASAVPMHATPPPITFQMPVSRNSHSFILWQKTGLLTSPAQKGLF